MLSQRLKDMISHTSFAYLALSRRPFSYQKALHIGSQISMESTINIQRSLRQLRLQGYEDNLHYTYISPPFILKILLLYYFCGKARGERERRRGGDGGIGRAGGGEE